jgi:biopolymer transport protein ExbD
MRIDPPPRRMMAEPLLPMINVVFLLLIFFLIVARMTPPPPVPVQVPKAAGQAVAGEVALYLAAEGTVAFGDMRGDGALAALRAMCAGPCKGPLMLHVDARADAAALAALLRQVSGMGWHDVQLVTQAR